MNDVMTAMPSAAHADDQDPSGRPKRGRHRISAIALLEQFGLVVLLAGLIAMFSILRPETFATVANWQVISISQAVLVVVAIALIMPLVSGRFDVSVGANLGLCAVAFAGLMSKNDQPLLVAMLAALVLGCLVGVVNGFVVAYLGVNSIIATLGMATIMGGLVSAYTNGIPISSDLAPSLSNLSVRTIAGVPLLFVIATGLALVVWFFLTQTAYGRELAAIGSNQRAAHLVGINVRRHIMLSFVASGFLAAIAGLLQVAATGSGDPSVGGLGFIVPALAAVFLGATTWDPGKYNVPGAVIGLLFVSTAVSGLALLGVRPWVGDVFNGGAVVIAIVISAQLRRRRSGQLEVGT